MNEAELNDVCLHREWEERQRREARLMAMNKDGLNAARFQQSETEANRIRELSDT